MELTKEKLQELKTKKLQELAARKLQAKHGRDSLPTIDHTRPADRGRIPEGMKFGKR